MFKQFSFITAVGLMLAAGIANADPKNSASGGSTPATSATSTPANAERRYCIVDTVTGSRIEQRVCKTLREWKAEGVDPTNP